MTDTTKESKRDTKAMLAHTFMLMSGLRWLKTGNGKVLQQEWRNVFTGEIEWRNVETVTQDKAE